MLEKFSEVLLSKISENRSKLTGITMVALKWECEELTEIKSNLLPKSGYQ